MDQLEFKKELTKITKIRADKPRILPPFHAAGGQQGCYELGYKEGVAALRKAQREYIKEMPDVI